MNISEIYEHIPVRGYPGWTLQRFGMMHRGEYRWRVFHNFKPVAISKPVSVEDAMRLAREYVQKATE